MVIGGEWVGHKNGVNMFFLCFFLLCLIRDWGVVIENPVLGNPAIGCILFSSSHFKFCLCYSIPFLQLVARRGFHD